MAMRIVSSRTEAELEADRRERDRLDALSDIRRALRTLTANLLRVARGNGHPWKLARQMLDFIEAYQAHWDVAGHYPTSWEMTACIDYDAALEEIRPGYSSPDSPAFDLELGKRITADGALQMVASRLLHQIPQQAAGSRELIGGLRLIDEARSAAGRRQGKPRGKRRPPDPIGTM